MFATQMTGTMISIYNVQRDFVSSQIGNKVCVHQ